MSRVSAQGWWASPQASAARASGAARVIIMPAARIELQAMELHLAFLWACATALITPTPRISLHKTALQATTYRIYNVAVPFEADPGASASSEEVSAGLVAATRQQVKKLQEKGKKKKQKRATLRSVRHVVRKSLDARHRLPEPRWGVRRRPKSTATSLESSGRCEALLRPASSAPPAVASLAKKRRAVVVGCGPAGLFAALQPAAAAGVAVLERGEPVEVRGRDIGRLMARRSLVEESNFCFGEGGAGTWSGRETDDENRQERQKDVRAVLRTLVFHGAPREILSQGSPHLGTDGLIGILKSLRKRLLEAASASIVPALTRPDLMVVNGMSYSRRHSVFANSAIVATVEAPCHDLLPPALVETIAAAATDAFERSMPGRLRRAILHGVETRTSAPLRVPRDDDSKESTSLPGLYPCGEGAGYAGGIVSAAVDGLRVARAAAATHGAPATDICENIGVLDVS
ncbi:5-formyltetrahydrofolate cyclo-ligase [Aureococcus anophagefferens]|uniref:5-formyltetrahydrofolate cyclo-ligase n=1 Tax=Aureococcus anophagefferens TaxID=44056 RepID=A0ABR1FMI6_AURAN